MHGGIVPGRHMELRRFVPARRNVCVRAMEYRNRMPVRELSPVRIGARHMPVQFVAAQQHRQRSEEHTSELQSLMRISYAVFCLKKKKKYIHKNVRGIMYINLQKRKK